MVIQGVKELIPQLDYNNLDFNNFDQENFPFDHLWQPSRTKQEVGWWVSSTLAYHFTKRAIDIVLAIIALIILAPLFIIIAILIKVDSTWTDIFYSNPGRKMG